MTKQRFVVYKAFDKNVKEMGNLLVAGGRHMPFSATDFTSDLLKSTYKLMHYGSFSSVDYWKSYAKAMGACRFQKVIYFN